MYQYPYGNAQQLNLDWVLGKIQELEAGSGGDAALEEVANALVSASFDTGVSYRRYDYCFYNGKLYRALNDTTGAFNPSDWMEVTLGDDIPVLTRLLNAVDTSLTSLQNTVNDLDSDDIDNASTVVSGATVTAALETLDTTITNLQNDVNDLDSDDIDNASLVVSGATVTAALDTLNGAINAITPLDTTPTSGSTKGVTSGGVFDAIGLANYVSPNDWITTNTATVSAASLPIRQIGNLLYLSGYATLNGSVAGNGAVLGTFSSVKPSGQRKIYGYAKYNNNQGFYFFNLNADGTLTTATGGGQFTGDVQFLDTITFA